MRVRIVVDSPILGDVEVTLDGGDTFGDENHETLKRLMNEGSARVARAYDIKPEEV